ncbi:MAG TPA: TrkA family potassium uptake protein [Spirochaetota bacterium]|nr:TrkA family potassium uptake protein [Spirochaetota bacterium]HPH03841.1 TrkA family potassium uptake protein [Spirochaetota bacterium]HPN82035.1 TrkA family potassium uptake protein [Spirochaetota bacterium]
MNRSLIIGLGTFGMTIAEELSAKGAEIVAVEVNESVMHQVSGKIPDVRVIDPSDPAWLGAIDPDSVDHAVVCIGNLEQSLLMTLQLVEHGFANIHARASTEAHRRILLSIGIRNVIFPELDAAKALADRITAPSIRSIVRLAGDKIMADFAIPMVFAGQSLVELDLRRRYNVTVIALRRFVPAIDSLTRENIMREQFLDAPKPDDPLEEGDVLVLVGTEENIHSLIEAWVDDDGDTA